MPERAGLPEEASPDVENLWCYGIWEDDEKLGWSKEMDNDIASTFGTQAGPRREMKTEVKVRLRRKIDY